MRACRNCQRAMLTADPKCGWCGAYTFGETDSLGQAGMSNTTSLDQITAEELPRIMTGFASIDGVLGGGKGIAPTSCVLFGGSPGAGKTSLTMQIASMVAAITGRWAYFLSAEMSPGEVRLMAERLCIANMSQFRVMKTMNGGATPDDTLLKEFPPGIFVVDSVSAICGKNRDAVLALAKQYKQLAVKYNAPTFLISHMSKEGDYAGGLNAQHEVDTLVTVGTFERDRSAVDLIEQGFPADKIDSVRELNAWKNRFGPANKPYHILMTEKGFVEIVLDERGHKGKKKRRGDDVDLDQRAELAGTKKDSTIIPATTAAAAESAAFRPHKLTSLDAGAINATATDGGTLPLALPRDAITHKGQRLVNRKMKASAQDDILSKVGGDAVKKKRPVMPKDKAKKHKAKAEKRA